MEAYQEKEELFRINHIHSRGLEKESLTKNVFDYITNILLNNVI